MNLENQLDKILKIQAFCRGHLIRAVIKESKKEYMEIFQDIEEISPKNYQKAKGWLDNPNLSNPKFGCFLKKLEKENNKKKLMEKLMFLTDKIELINKKIIERKIELGIND